MVLANVPVASSIIELTPHQKKKKSFNKYQTNLKAIYKQIYLDCKKA